MIMDVSQIEIETERLWLVSASQKYAEQIFSEYRGPVTRYMNFGPPASLEIQKERFKQCESELKAGELLSVVVFKKESGEFLGRFSLENLDRKDPEIGGWLKHSAHGHRYGTEAVSALRIWADENLNYSHLIWPCVSVNVGSRKLAENLGGKVQRTFEKKNGKGEVFLYVEYWIPNSRTLKRPF